MTQTSTGIRSLSRSHDLGEYTRSIQHGRINIYQFWQKPRAEYRWLTYRSLRSRCVRHTANNCDSCVARALSGHPARRRARSRFHYCRGARRDAARTHRNHCCGNCERPKGASNSGDAVADEVYCLSETYQNCRVRYRGSIQQSVEASCLVTSSTERFWSMIRERASPSTVNVNWASKGSVEWTVSSRAAK